MSSIKFVPGSHIRHWISVYSQFTVPVPPLEVQNEVVRVLDNFTELSAKLSAELEARKKQYEYYRDKLLNFEEMSETLDTLHTHTHTPDILIDKK